MNYKLINNTQKTPLETIMNNRGIKTEDIQHFLNPTQSDVYPNKLLDNMEQGIKLLLKHIKQNNKIFIQVDADCDGYTSSALLINYLYNLFQLHIQDILVQK